MDTELCVRLDSKLANVFLQVKERAYLDRDQLLVVDLDAFDDDGGGHYIPFFPTLG